MDLEWETPPASAFVVGSGQKPGMYRQIADELREHVGEWAVVPEVIKNGKPQPRTEGSAKNLAQNLRRGIVKGFDQGTFETAVKGTKIWARCTDAGEDQDDEPAPRARARAHNDLTPKVRAWANRNGYDLGERGRIPDKVTEAYLNQHPEDRKLKAVN